MDLELNHKSGKNLASVSKILIRVNKVLTNIRKVLARYLVCGNLYSEWAVSTAVKN